MDYSSAFHGPALSCRGGCVAECADVVQWRTGSGAHWKSSPLPTLDLVGSYQCVMSCG